MGEARASEFLTSSDNEKEREVSWKLTRADVRLCTQQITLVQSSESTSWDNLKWVGEEKSRDHFDDRSQPEFSNEANS